MNKGMLLVLLFFLLSCEKKEVIDPSLLGKWEAAYYFTTDSDTTFFVKGTPMSCAYVVLPYDYNSGFELIDESTGDLLLCGGNKSNFFKWSYKDQVLMVEDGDNIYKVFIEERTKNSMKITLNYEEFFYMKKL